MAERRPIIKSPLVVLALAYIGFVLFGLPDGLLGVAWPSMRTFFGVSLESLGALLLAFTAGYLVAGAVSGYLIARISNGTLLVMFCVAMSVWLFGYALSSQWWMLVAISVIGGFGAGSYDAAINTYVATRFSARVMNWLHASFGLGATIGPIIMTSILVAGGRWQWAYGAVALGQLLMALSFALTRNRWQISDKGPDNERSKSNASSLATLRLPSMWLSIAIFGIYVGLEISAGQWTFTLLTEGRGMAVGTAGAWVSVYWGALTAGRIALGTLAGTIPVYRLLRLCIVGALIGTVVFWIDVTPWLSFISLALIGLAFGPIFPSLTSTTPDRVGDAHTANAVGFQISATALGGALLPGLVGVLASVSIEFISLSLIVMVVALAVMYEVLVRLTSKT